MLHVLFIGCSTYVVPRCVTAINLAVTLAALVLSVVCLVFND